MQIPIDLVDEITDRAIAAFTKIYDTFDQPARHLTEISDCGQFVELHNRNGLLSVYKIKHLPNYKFKLSYIERN